MQIQDKKMVHYIWCVFELETFLSSKFFYVTTLILFSFLYIYIIDVKYKIIFYLDWKFSRCFVEKEDLQRTNGQNVTAIRISRVQ